MNRSLGGILLVALTASCKGTVKVVDETGVEADTDSDTDADTDTDSDTDSDSDADADSDTDADADSDADTDTDPAISDTGATDTASTADTGGVGPGDTGLPIDTGVPADTATPTDTSTPTDTGTGNTAPVGNDDLFSTVVDQPLDVAVPGVLANDVDGDGDTLTALLDTQPAHGTVALNPDGSFTYTPDTGYSGTDSFTYVASDGVDTSGPVTVTLTIATSATNPPMAVDDAYTLTEDGTLAVDAAGGLLANDTDADGDTLTAVLVQGPTSGTLTLDPDGAFTYVPDPDFSGVTTFTYQASDGSSLSPAATVTLSVSAVNDPPQGADDLYTVDEDSSLDVAAAGVLANDADPDGDPLTATLVQGPDNGTLTLNADGSFVYTGNPNYAGTDGFTYLVSDGRTGVPVDVVVEVTPINDPPVAVPDFYTTAADQDLAVPASTGVLANDADPVEGDSLTATLQIDVAHGVLALAADGSFTYTPDTGFAGTDTFTYVANDGTDDSAPVVVTLTVGGTNGAPQAANDDYAMDEDQVLDVPAAGILANDSDPDGDPLSITVLDGPTHGTLTVNADGSFTYTPDSDYNGQDGFTYQIDDGIAADTATVDIEIRPVDDAPVAVDDTYAAPAGSPVNGDVTTNDYHPDGGGVGRVRLIMPPPGDLQIDEDGNFVYTPPPGFVGVVTFTYQLIDGDFASNVATVTLVVEAANRPPVATDDLYSGEGPLSGNVLANDADPDGDALAAVITGQPSDGTVALDADGGFTYTPDPGFTGTDAFTYVANDGQADSAEATVTLEITSDANQPPVAADDAYTLDEDTTLAADVTDNDTDPDGDPLTVTVVLPPSHGTLQMGGDGSFTYQPDPDYNGPDAFTYVLDDGLDQSGVATVALTIDPVNDPPVGNSDRYGMLWNTTLTVPASLGVLANDYDIDGDTLTVTLDQGPQDGTLTLNPDGSFEYTPPPGFADDVTFTYTVTDGIESVTVTVTIEVLESGG